MLNALSRFFLIFIFVFSSLSCASHSRTGKYYNVGESRVNPIIRVSIDKEYSIEHRTLIQKAFDAWEKATTHKLQFVLIWDVPKPGRYHLFSKPKENAGIFFWNLPKTSYHIPQESIEEWRSYYGVMVYGRGENSGNIIVFKEIDMEKFYPVVLHEVGHLIGLNHIKAKSVMHPSAIFGCISPLDANQVCELYKCIPRPECDQNGEPL